MGLPITRWLTFPIYAKWIVEQKIIEFIFLENPHDELIKRSQEILILLANDENIFSSEIVEYLWFCCKDKHEDIIRSTYDLIQEIALYMPLERLAQMWSKIQNIKENEFDEKAVTFLKNFTINAKRNLKNARYDKG